MMIKHLIRLGLLFLYCFLGIYRIKMFLMIHKTEIENLTLSGSNKKKMPTNEYILIYFCKKYVYKTLTELYP